MSRSSIAPLYQREIAYDHETHDYALYLDKELIGFARNYHEAEITLDQLVYELMAGEPPYAALSMSADPEPDPPPPVPPGQGGDSPETGPWADDARPPCPCPACRLDTTLAQQAARAARIVAGYAAAPLLARWDAPGFYYVAAGHYEGAGHYVMFRHPTRSSLFLHGAYGAERAERLAARLNAMRCRMVAP